MSSISELFGEEGMEGSGASFDPGNLNAVLDQVMAARPPIGAQSQPTQPPSGAETGGGAPGGDEAPPETPPVVGDPAQEEPEDGTHPVHRPPPPPPPDRAPTPSAFDDPFAALSPDQRNELLLVQQALQDPDRQDRIRQAYLGVEPAAPVAQAPAPPPPPAPAPELPEEITPNSFEAQLWRDNQDMKAQLASLTQATQAQTEQTLQQRAVSAVRAAGAQMSVKYPNLSQAEVTSVMVSPVTRDLAVSLANANGGDFERAVASAADFVIRSDDTLLAKVLGTPAPPPAPAPVLGTPPAPTPRKRNLHALSGAASPVGEAPQQRKPIEHREDGRLTEQSRQDVIAQYVGGVQQEGS